MRRSPSLRCRHRMRAACHHPYRRRPQPAVPPPAAATSGQALARAFPVGTCSGLLSVTGDDAPTGRMPWFSPSRLWSSRRAGSRHPLSPTAHAAVWTHRCRRLVAEYGSPAKPPSGRLAVTCTRPTALSSTRAREISASRRATSPARTERTSRPPRSCRARAGGRRVGGASACPRTRHPASTSC